MLLTASVVDAIPKKLKRRFLITFCISWLKLRFRDKALETMRDEKVKKVLCTIGALWMVCLYSGANSAAQPAAGEKASTRLVFAGSGASLLIMGILADWYNQNHPDIKIEIPESIGSGGGIRAAGEGAIAVGLVARALKEEEKRFGLTIISYAQTGVVIAVHPSVTENEITFEDVLDIYRGTKTRWEDGQEIIVLTREPGDSSVEILQRAISGFKEVYEESIKAKRWTTLFTDQEMDRTLAKIPYAIGFSDIGNTRAKDSGIKALAINGIPPTLENVSNGTYPFVRTLSLVYLKAQLPEEARSFIEFIRSAEGANIMRNAGYLPVE